MGFLVGLAIVRKSQRLLLPRLKDLGLEVEPMVLDRTDWVSVLTRALKDTEADSAWALTFPWKVPSALLDVPSKGFVNFHFGLLPKYKGADPIFWQFKNLEEHGGLTVHLMNESIDEGPVLLREEFAVMPGENYGFHCLRLGSFAKELISKVVDAIEAEPPVYLKLDTPDEVIERKPTEQDLTIQWDSQSAAEVEWLVNASNPVYGGARTRMNDTEMQILEVTPVTINEPIEAEPGQIVMADVVYGVIVACADKECIRITIAKTGEGYLSGVKLFNLGFTPGHKFG